MLIKTIKILEDGQIFIDNNSDFPDNILLYFGILLFKTGIFPHII